MAMVTPPSRSPVMLALRALEAAQKAESGKKPEPTPAPSKSNAKPPAKRVAKKGPR